MQLHNKVNKNILKDQLMDSKEERTTISLYKYYQLGNPQLFRDHLYIMWDKLGIFGRTYVAHEGINAQISVPTVNLDAFREELNTITFLKDIRLNKAIEDDGKSFTKLIIKVRDKIVADGIDDPTFDSSDKGKHLSAKEFNELTDKDDTIVVDMRNHYESEVGHFENAILPDVDTFREQLPMVVDDLEPMKDKDIVMYCTGGIRCEKASAYLKHNGFKNVYQLEGGIIEYTRQVGDQGLRNKFKGKNFVFDDRLNESISTEVIAHCHQCGEPADTHVNCANTGCNLLFIQCDSCKSKMEGCCSDKCVDVIHMSEEDQKEWRKANRKGRLVYRKGRFPKE
jgi:UPF0176 protein